MTPYLFLQSYFFLYLFCIYLHLVELKLSLFFNFFSFCFLLFYFIFFWLILILFSSQTPIFLIVPLKLPLFLFSMTLSFSLLSLPFLFWLVQDGSSTYTPTTCSRWYDHEWLKATISLIHPPLFCFSSNSLYSHISLSSISIFFHLKLKFQLCHLCLWNSVISCFLTVFNNPFSVNNRSITTFISVFDCPSTWVSGLNCFTSSTNWTFLGPVALTSPVKHVSTLHSTILQFVCQNQFGNSK